MEQWAKVDIFVLRRAHDVRCPLTIESQLHDRKPPFLLKNLFVLLLPTLFFPLSTIVSVVASWTTIQEKYTSHNNLLARISFTKTLSAQCSTRGSGDFRARFHRIVIAPTFLHARHRDASETASPDQVLPTTHMQDWPRASFDCRKI